MTTWVQPIHHPWFDRSPLKRKLSSADDERRSSPYQRLSPSPTSRAKRRKFNTLEHGFAHLSLAPAPVHPNSSGLLITPIVHPTASSSEYSTFPPTSVVLPSSVEEPPHELETLAPEVSMECEDERECKHSSVQVCSSSFENTCTDLSDKPMASTDSDMPKACADRCPRFSISTPLLQRLRKQQTAPLPIIPISSPSTDGGALVLYRPLRPPSPSPKVDEHAESMQEVITPEAAAHFETSKPAPIDDDAMDVE